MKSKKYVFVVMMNMDPMGSDWDWQPYRAFMSRKEAQDFIKTEWKREWGEMKRIDIPIEKHEWFDIDKVVLG